MNKTEGLGSQKGAPVNGPKAPWTPEIDRAYHAVLGRVRALPRVRAQDIVMWAGYIERALVDLEVAIEDTLGEASP